MAQLAVHRLFWAQEIRARSVFLFVPTNRPHFVSGFPAIQPVAADGPNLDHFWMPFTANRRYKKNPRLITGAQGMYFWTDDDRRLLDATAGLWCVNAGHSRTEIGDAIAQQYATLDYAPSFQVGHPGAFELAERLSRLAPGVGARKLDRVFFTCSGSDAVDTALKIALAYHRANGEASRTRFVGRERGYHGVGFGGLSVGGIVNNRRNFISLPGVDHIRHTHNPSQDRFCPGMPEHGAELADDLERLVQLHGAENIAALVVEPVAGSTGVLLPPKGYLERLKEICDRHGIILIFDEIITGFGRLGAPFGADYFGICPDIMAVAKGLTNGAIPMGAVLVARHIHDEVVSGPESEIEFAHGYTFSAHPLACAAAMAALDIYEGEGLLTRALSLRTHWEKALDTLRQVPIVRDIRRIGLAAGIDLTPDPNRPGQRAYDVFVDCFQRGALVRVTGDVIALSPPLIIEPDQITEICTILYESLARAR